MENKEYLSEEKYQQNNLKLKKVGKVLLIAGIVVMLIGALLIILSFVGFGNNITSNISKSTIDASKTVGIVFGNIGLMAIGSTLSSIGLFSLFAGAIIMFISHRREIVAYSTQQIMPVAKEGIEKMAPSIGVAAKEIAKGIKEGINEADKKKSN